MCVCPSQPSAPGPGSGQGPTFCLLPPVLKLLFSLPSDFRACPGGDRNNMRGQSRLGNRVVSTRCSSVGTQTAPFSSLVTKLCAVYQGQILCTEHSTVNHTQGVQAREAQGRAWTPRTYTHYPVAHGYGIFLGRCLHRPLRSFPGNERQKVAEAVFSSTVQLTTASYLSVKKPLP